MLKAKKPKYRVVAQHVHTFGKDAVSRPVTVTRDFPTLLAARTFRPFGPAYRSTYARITHNIVKLC